MQHSISNEVVVQPIDVLAAALTALGCFSFEANREENTIVTGYTACTGALNLGLCLEYEDGEKPRLMVDMLHLDQGLPLKEVNAGTALFLYRLRRAWLTNPLWEASFDYQPDEDGGGIVPWCKFDLILDDASDDELQMALRHAFGVGELLGYAFAELKKGNPPSEQLLMTICTPSLGELEN